MASSVDAGYAEGISSVFGMEQARKRTADATETDQRDSHESSLPVR